MNTQATPSIQTSAMLLDLTISVYTGRKIDRKTADEVTSAAGAGSKRATSVHKHLFAGDSELADINSYAGWCRARVAQLTMPWNDTGTRLLPTRQFFVVKQELDAMQQEFERRVAQFVAGYPQKISNAAFALGKLFDRSEYPMPDQVRAKFSFTFHFSPVPDSGDFRVDIPNEQLSTIRAQFEQVANDRVRQAVADVWNRIYETASTLSYKMTEPAEGSKTARPRLHESTVAQAKELVSLLEGLNLFNDPLMEDMRATLAQTLEGVSLTELREDVGVRADVRAKMDSILGKFA